MTTTMARHSVTIRDTHLDSYGHVNNARYLDLYEDARWALISTRGFNEEETLARRQGPVVLEANIKFMRELVLSDNITITTEVISYEGKIGRMVQKMIRADNVIASEALFVFGLMDLDARKLIPPTPEWKHAIGMD